MRRFLPTLNLSAFLLGVLTLVVVVNVFAQRPELRSRIDATKTRAYSLSPQTHNLLSGLEGEWTIAMLVNEQETDRAVRRQVDEVLERFRRASPLVSVTRMDPTDPRSLAEYETLLTRLRTIYHDLTAEYDEHLGAAREAFDDLLLFAQQQSGELDQLTQLLAAEESSAEQLAQPMRMLGLLAEQGDQIAAEVDNALDINDGQPIPDYESARSILAQALSTAANELYDAAEAFEQWTQSVDAVELRQYGSGTRREYEGRARQLARIVDPLQHLPPLELSRIGRVLAEGEAAVVLSPDGAAVIPANQLLPKSNIRRTSEGRVSFDQRFRGEQILAATMRSLQVDHMPKVVFVHNDETSILRSRDRDTDLVGIATMLDAARFEVTEWIVDDEERPAPEAAQPIVWVVVPPAQRHSLELSERELSMIDAVRDLITDGESVLLSAYPSFLPRYGQPDPWASLGREMGVKIDTSRVIFERFRTAQDRFEVQRNQTIQAFSASHPIARAVHGQQTSFNLPMALELEARSGVEHNVIAEIAPSSRRWLESDWAVDPTTLGNPDDDARYDQPLPIAVAAERINERTGRDQRMIAVGAGGWMLSYIADAAVGLDGPRGDRVALLNPGNHELMLASIAWLAQLDDLIAQSPASQEVARLGEISDRAGTAWFWIIVMALPGSCLMLGLAVWGIRRR